MEIFKVPVRGSYGYCGWSVLVVLNISNNSDRSLQKGGLFLSRISVMATGKISDRTKKDASK